MKPTIPPPASPVYTRKAFEIQRSDFQSGADPASIGKLNECLLWTPWRTVKTVKIGEEPVKDRADAFAYLHTVAVAKNGLYLANDSERPEASRFRLVEVVSFCEVIA